jgi:GNAT superfamily N-acetyltransferase
VALDGPGAMRNLTFDDIGACLRLAEDRRWAAEEIKWRMLLEIGSGLGIFGADRSPVGTVIVTRYPTDVATIGMLLVAGRFGRQGLGRRLMEAAIAEADTNRAYLYATPQGRPLYERIGFSVIDTVIKHVGPFREDRDAPDEIDVLPFSEANQGETISFDGEAFGADRSAVYHALRHSGRLIVAVDESGVLGLAGGWDNLGTLTIGPVVAKHTAVAQALVARLARQARGNVRIDIPSQQVELASGLLPRTPTSGARPAHVTRWPPPSRRPRPPLRIGHAGAWLTRPLPEPAGRAGAATPTARSVPGLVILPRPRRTVPYIGASSSG